MNRVVFLIDGFNLYHSLVDAQNDKKVGGRTTKWLDIQSLCTSCLQPVRQYAREKVDIERIHYFSASPVHRSIDKQQRHALYMRCLKSSGISVHLGRFKKKEAKCFHCSRDLIKYEEKETDVAIAAKLFEVCYNDEADSIVIITGDTDLIPAVKVCQSIFSSKFICFAFPYRRVNRELKQLCRGSFKINCKKYLENQYPDTFALNDGTIVRKPLGW